MPLLLFSTNLAHLVLGFARLEALGISRKVAKILWQKLVLLDLRQDCWHYMAVQFIQLVADDLLAPDKTSRWVKCSARIFSRFTWG